MLRKSVQKLTELGVVFFFAGNISKYGGKEEVTFGYLLNTVVFVRHFTYI